jgi:hypothetical protein
MGYTYLIHSQGLRSRDASDRSDFSIYYPLATMHRFVKDPRLPGSRLPSSGPRDTKPLIMNVLIRSPLSVKPVTGECDLKLGRRTTKRDSGRVAQSLP